jgi:23S rRNA (uracil1939-C5)-methyltransferase
MPLVKLKKGTILDLQVRSLALGGRGVADLNGLVIFVDRGLPGDRVKARVTRVRDKYAESKVEELIEPSRHRIAPACEHFGICGGCRWQNLEYSVQKEYKQDQLSEALIHIGGLAEPPVEPIIAAHKIYYYRNKMEFSFHAGDDGETLLGLHKRGRFQDVFQLKACHLQSEVSNRIVEFVRKRSIELGLPPYHIVRHEGYTRFLVIREGKFTGQVLVNIVTGGGEYPQVKTLGEEIGREFDQVVSVSHTVNRARANIAKGQSEEVIYGSDHIYEQLGGKKYRISANSFFQTNSYQTQRLYDLAVELATPEGSDRMLDLYCGTGTIAIYFSDLVRSVVGVETIPEAVADARVNARTNGAVDCEFVAADVEEYLASVVREESRYDLMVLDPPRAGCHPKTIRHISILRPRKLVYISCNPATLARDIKTLVGSGYRLERAVPLDLFPHTPHIEAACRLTLPE